VIAWQQFRHGILDRLGPDERFVALDDIDTSLGRCPSCKADLPNYAVVRFRGVMCEVDIRCRWLLADGWVDGCTREQLADAFGLSPIDPMEAL
jgi:hypothetical protein